MSGNKRLTGMVFCVFGLLVLAGAAFAGSPETLGRVVEVSPDDPSVLIDTPRSLDVPSRVTTGHEPLVVVLNNGKRMELAARTIAEFAMDDDGNVEVLVSAGLLSFVEPGGKRSSAGRNSRIVLPSSTFDQRPVPPLPPGLPARTQEADRGEDFERSRHIRR
ncbi:MAG: hypothetical protein GY716_19650 [bacterium]|nr:hypothetical protein [bacterium]